MRNKNKEIASILFDLLKKAVEKPEAASKKLIEACATQGGLSKLNMPELGVIPISLNTLKQAAGIVNEKGGWDTFNNLRKQIKNYNRFEDFPKQKHRSGSKDDLKKQIASLKDKLDKSTRARIVIESAYVDLLSIMKPYVNQHPELKFKWGKHKVLFFEEKLGLRMIKGGKDV